MPIVSMLYLTFTFIQYKFRCIHRLNCCIIASNIGFIYFLDRKFQGIQLSLAAYITMFYMHIRFKYFYFRCKHFYVRYNFKYDGLKDFNHGYKNHYFRYNNFDYGYKFLYQIQFTINLTTSHSHMSDSKRKTNSLSSYLSAHFKHLCYGYNITYCGCMGFY